MLAKKPYDPDWENEEGEKYAAIEHELHVAVSIIGVTDIA